MELGVPVICCRISSSMSFLSWNLKFQLFFCSTTTRSFLLAGIIGLKVMNSEDMSDMVKKFTIINPKTQGRGGGILVG